MAYCANCGTQAEGRFCPKCGSPLPAAGGATGTTPAPPAAQVQSSGMTDNMAAALCYLLTILTGILFLVLEPYNKNKTIRFHAFQSIFFGVALIAVDIVLSILSSIIVHIPFFGWLIILLWPIFGLACLALWVFLMYKAYNNEKFKLPVIGDLAEKQA
jgi:uncharacterized membrane protein